MRSSPPGYRRASSGSSVAGTAARISTTPRALCPKCGSSDLEAVPASGRGTVYATSVVRVRPGHGEDYNIALVDLAEGPRMMTRVVDTDPQDVRIGDAVTAFVGEIEGSRVVLFRPAAAASGRDGG